METIIRTETRKRGFIGKALKWAFILFNILMLILLVQYWAQVGEVIGANSNEAHQAGAAVGGMIGTSMLLFFWVSGAIILGLFTLFSRGKKIIVEKKVAQ